MARLGAVIAGMILAAGSDAAVAQDAPPQPSERPRLEFGAGGGVGVVLIEEDSGVSALVDARVGVRLSRRWSLEGAFQWMPTKAGGTNGLYRVQALRRLGSGGPGGVRTFATVGAAGEISRSHWPEYRWPDASNPGRAVGADDSDTGACQLELAKVPIQPTTPRQQGGGPKGWRPAWSDPAGFAG